MQPFLKQDDIAVFAPSKRYKAEDVILYDNYGVDYVKRLTSDGAKWRLTGDNPSDSDDIHTIDPARIRGRLIVLKKK